MKYLPLLVDPGDPLILWVGTKGSGLHRLDTRTKTFTYLNTQNGLPNDVIYGMLNDDEGNLWMSSNKGIIQYDPSNGKIRNFTKADGMQSDEFNTWAYFKSPTGEMLFGGINGLNVFHPNDLKENPVVPKVWITGLIVNNEKINVKDSTGVLQLAIEYTSEITLPFSKNSIALEFAALEFSTPLKNRFRYFLEGAEEPWVHEDIDNKAQYLNLSPGSYTFKVKAANGDGVWNEQPTELKITILSPWYRSGWAYFVYALLMGIGIWQFQKFRENRLRLKLQVAQEQKEAARLKELDEFKSRLYTNITHEFRTPLTIISGMTEQIRKAPSQWLEKGTDMIKQNTQSLLNLVNQILELRKLDAKELRVNMVHGDIVQYLRYLTETYQSYAKGKNLELHFLSAQPSIMMDYDSDKILRIISNLLSNAIKYTPAGGNIYFHIDKKTENENLMLQLRVEDTGIGIPESELPFVFDRFYQVTDSMIRKGELARPNGGGPDRLRGSGGTGIGLALTQELVKLLKGKISVTSHVGVGLPGEKTGTTFLVQLPITKESEIQVGDTQTPPFPKEEHLPTDHTRPLTLTNDSAFTSSEIESETIKNSSLPTLLIIEDNPDVTQYLIACLQESYQLLTTQNGQEGIDRAIEQVPDLIISDVMMPVKNGYEVCATLKEDERTSHIPIILLTAKADLDSKISGLKKGADAYLTKPFESKELLAQLENLWLLRKKLQERYSQLPSTTFDSAGIGTPLEDQFIQKIKNIIHENIDDESFGIQHLCRALAMSRTQVHNKIKALTGKSTSLLIRSIRLQKAKELLETTDLTVSQIAYEVGFKYPAHFSNYFLEEFGEPPSRTRK